MANVPIGYTLFKLASILLKGKDVVFRSELIATCVRRRRVIRTRRMSSLPSRWIFKEKKDDDDGDQ
jgi:hypothetical protein